MRVLPVVPLLAEAPSWGLITFGILFVIALAVFIGVVLGGPSNMDPDGG